MKEIAAYAFDPALPGSEASVIAKYTADGLAEVMNVNSRVVEESIARLAAADERRQRRNAKRIEHARRGGYLL